MMIDSATTTMLPSSGARLVQADALNPLGRGLVEFTLFRNLPMELRLKIWRWSFPRGRMINLAQQPQVLSSNDEANSELVMSTYPLPVSLHVNSESRMVTLEHYYVLFVEDMEPSEDGNKVRPPLCFNPNLDHVFISMHMVNHEKSANWFVRWIYYLETAAPALLWSIEDLTVLDIRFDENTFAWLVLRYILMFATSQGDEVAAAVPLNEFGFILAFHGLRRLILVVDQYCRSSERLHIPAVEKDLKQMKNVFICLMACYKSNFGDDPPLVEVENRIASPLE
jgi:hypothetical protein